MLREQPTKRSDVLKRQIPDPKVVPGRPKNKTAKARFLLRREGAFQKFCGAKEITKRADHSPQSVWARKTEI